MFLVPSKVNDFCVLFYEIKTIQNERKREREKAATMAQDNSTCGMLGS